METILQKLDETTKFLKSKGFTGASVGIVLGTGLGSFVERIAILESISYVDIPHFPQSTVEFH